MKNLFVLLLCLYATSAGAQNSNASASVGVTTNVEGVVGQQNAQQNTQTLVGGQQVGVEIKGGTQVAPLTNTVSPGLMSPQIFGPLGNTPGSASVPFIAAANKICDVRYTRTSMPKTTVIENTESGKTRIIFSQYPALLEKGNSPVLLDEVIPPDLTPRKIERAVCLATLTVMTKEKHGNETDFAIVQDDGINLMFKTIRGFKKAVLASLITSVSAASGVSSDATSFGVGGALGKILSAVTTLGLGPSFTQGSGNSNPTNFPGGTFLVLAIEEPGGKTIDTGQLGQFYSPPAPTNGVSSAIKNEATKP